MENEVNTSLSDQKLTQILSTGQLAGDLEIIRKAYDQLSLFCQREKTPERIIQALEIVSIVINELNLSAEPVLAIFLKPLVDNGTAGKELVEKEYGPAVREIISGLQKIDRIDTTKTSTNSENLIKLLLTLSDDIRVILVRLGRQLYEVRHLIGNIDDRQKQVCEETSLLYVPIAHRIGLYRIKTEMEDRVMHFSDPRTYLDLEEKIRETQKDRDQYAAAFIEPIEERLKENGFECEIKSRTKSIPSIHKKMIAQKVEFERVYDLFAIRIIIKNNIENEKADCWKVYSLVTDIYTPNPRRLRDWISFPKSTGYESLHTTVIGPEGRWVEVQIRTQRMDEIAEKSFAAHWKYKSGETGDPKPEFYAAIREMLEKPVQSSGEKTANLEKRALYTDEIFVFTPKGDLKKLRTGYTVLDFAFEVHTTVGTNCTGAIVNGKMVPLKHVLHNGDTVRILTSKTQKPNHEWLDFVRSPRVIAKIRHALKMESYKDSDYGKEIIKNKVIQLGFEFKDTVINTLVGYFGCKSYLDLYQKFGEGKLDPVKIKKALAEPEPETPEVSPGKEEILPERMTEPVAGKQDYIVIDRRLNAVQYVFARCCNPIPGDKIFAFVSVTQGIKVHKTNCSNAHQLVTRYPYRILEARWKDLTAEKDFTANLIVSGEYRENIVNKLTQFLTNDLDVKIRSSKLQMHPGNNYTWEVGIFVSGKMNLSEIMKRLMKMKSVTNVRKLTR
jgi:GTP diphosphokinase / guanosine-3',5'-bis(diphosphate) 3'-diphosphatase